MGAKIKAARTLKGLSQAALGKLAGIGKAMVSAIERGTDMPSVLALVKIGDALGTGVDELVYGGGGGRYPQAALPGLGLDERIAALPEAYREYVILALKRAERWAKTVPAEFLKPPTDDNYTQFEAHLRSLSAGLPPEEP